MIMVPRRSAAECTWYAASRAADASASDILAAAQRWDWLQHEVRREAEAHQNTESLDLPRRAFHLLRTEVLSGAFVAESSNVAATLMGGDHNCLTTTILYLDLCQELGIQATAIAGRGHVAVMVTTHDDQQYAIELTESCWRPARYRAWEAVGKTDLRQLSTANLIARVHYNRGRQCALDGDFPSAVRHFLVSRGLDRDYDDTDWNLRSTFSDWHRNAIARGDDEAACACRRLEFAAYPELTPRWLTDNEPETR